MNPELVKELVKTIESTREFVATQAPDVIQQVYRWQLALSYLGIILGLFPGAVSYFFIKKGIEKDEDGWYLLAAPPAVFSIIVFYVNTCDLLQLYLAPKVFLVQYLSHLK